MAYRLSFSDEPASAVRRAATDQLDGAIEQLADAHADPVEAIHDVRKRLKKTRSLLRLARPSMGSRDYRRLNRALRDRGRVLSGTRDADVMMETVDDLRKRFAGHDPVALFDAIRVQLADRASRVRDDAQAEIPAHTEALRLVRSHVHEWPVDALDTAALVRGLARSYTRGRDAVAVADADPTTANLHEWRKRVKDLWYQLRLLRDAWPGVMKATADEAKALSQVLGDDHDLGVLAQLLAGDRELTAEPSADRDRLLELIERRRGELLEQSRLRGRRLYAESPKAFRRRLRTYVRSAARDAVASSA